MDKEYDMQLDKLRNILDSFGLPYGIIADTSVIAESILKAGAIIPPVCVDQTLYVYDKHNNPSFDRVVEVKVYAIRIDTAKNDKRFCVKEKSFGWGHNYMATFKWSSIGKSIFYTYKEAEDKMKGRKK